MHRKQVGFMSFLDGRTCARILTRYITLIIKKRVLTNEILAKT